MMNIKTRTPFTHGLYRQLRQYPHRQHSQSGQVALIILLIMVVVLTIGVSIASRSIMDITLSRQEEQGGRTFQAAESGVEDALSKDLANDALFSNDTFSGSLSDVGNADVDYTVARKKTLETRLDEGAAVEVDVTGAIAGNQVEINWGAGKNCSSSDPSQNASSLLIRTYKTVAGVRTVRNYGYGACAYTDGYTLTGTQPGDAGFYRKVALVLEDGDTFIRIQPNYNDTTLRVTSLGWTLPVQYYTISSQARSQLGNETKAIQVSRSLPTYPSVLDYVLYSGTTITK